MARPSPAPEFQIQKWVNIDEALSVSGLKGKVIVAYAFQMLCPGCVETFIPQAKKVHANFAGDDVEVIGLHTVFEHHAAMQETSLKAFMHEYRIMFPVGIDEPGDNSPIPKTMETYLMQGTPTLLLIDRNGNLRRQQFGHVPDLLLGAEIMSLVLEG